MKKKKIERGGLMRGKGTNSERGKRGNNNQDNNSFRAWFYNSNVQQRPLDFGEEVRFLSRLPLPG